VDPYVQSILATMTGNVGGGEPADEWQYSTDQKTWASVPSTMKATSDIAGLAAGTVYSFRFRGITQAGSGDWSQIVTLLVA